MNGYEIPYENRFADFNKMIKDFHTGKLPRTIIDEFDELCDWVHTRGNFILVPIIKDVARASYNTFRAVQFNDYFDYSLNDIQKISRGIDSPAIKFFNNDKVPESYRFYNNENAFQEWLQKEHLLMWIKDNQVIPLWNHNFKSFKLSTSVDVSDFVNNSLNLIKQRGKLF